MRVGLPGGEPAQLAPLEGQQHQAAPPLRRAAGGAWPPLPNWNGGGSRQAGAGKRSRAPAPCFSRAKSSLSAAIPTGLCVLQEWDPTGCTLTIQGPGRLLVPVVRVWTAVSLQCFVFHGEGAILALPVHFSWKLGFQRVTVCGSFLVDTRRWSPEGRALLPLCSSPPSLLCVRC